MFYGSRVTSSLRDSENVSSIVDEARDPGSQALPAGALRADHIKWYLEMKALAARCQFLTEKERAGRSASGPIDPGKRAWLALYLVEI
jgi:hypothetical protein